MASACGAPVEARREYAKRLPPQLVKDHGKKKRYTQSEIDRSVQNAGLDVDWICWGYLFLDQATFDAIHAASGESCPYAAMHQEMGGYLAENAKSSGWFGSGFDCSAFDITQWDWPDLSDWASFDLDIGDIGGDIGGDF